MVLQTDMYPSHGGFKQQHSYGHEQDYYAEDDDYYGNSHGSSMQMMKQTGYRGLSAPPPPTTNHHMMMSHGSYSHDKDKYQSGYGYHHDDVKYQSGGYGHHQEDFKDKYQSGYSSHQYDDFKDKYQGGYSQHHDEFKDSYQSGYGHHNSHGQYGHASSDSAANFSNTSSAMLHTNGGGYGTGMQSATQSHMSMGMATPTKHDTIKYYGGAQDYHSRPSYYNHQNKSSGGNWNLKSL